VIISVGIISAWLFILWCSLSADPNITDHHKIPGGIRVDYTLEWILRLIFIVSPSMSAFMQCKYEYDTIRYDRRV